MQKKIVFVVFLLGLLSGFLFYAGRTIYYRYTPIKVGILHSLTGNLALSEKPIVDALLFAIDEINSNGGLLDRKVMPVIFDGASNPEEFGRKAEQLIVQEKVALIIGSYTTDCRKAVKKVVEDYGHLFICPVQSEGLELSEQMILTGATANQQVFPALLWLTEQVGKKIFIVGNEEIYARAVGELVHLLSRSIDAEVVEEVYLPIETQDVREIIEKIIQKQPSVIVNLFYGDIQGAFFQALKMAGLSSDRIPNMLFTISEVEVQRLGVDLMVGNYASWSYFQSLDTPENKAFVEAFQSRYGIDRPINDPMQIAYISLHLWAEAARIGRSVDPTTVIRYLRNRTMVAPEGIVSIDPYAYAMWRPSRIGKINKDGQFDVVWSSEKAIYPVLYPFKSRREWEEMLSTFYKKNGATHDL